MNSPQTVLLSTPTLEPSQLIPRQVLLLTIQVLILTIAYITLHINYLLLKSQVKSLAAKH